MGRGARAGAAQASFAGSDFTPVPKERRGRTVRRIAGFFRPYRLQVIVVMASIVVTSLLGVVNPILLKELIDVAIPQQDLVLLNVLVVAMIAIPIISGLIGVGQTYLNNRVGQNVMQDLRDALYAHLQSMPLRFFTETRTGEIQSRLSNDVGGVQSRGHGHGQLGLLEPGHRGHDPRWPWCSSTGGSRSSPSWPCPSSCSSPTAWARSGGPASAETQTALADVSAITEETLSVSGILLAKTFGQQAESVRRFRVANARLASLQLRQSLVGRWFFMLVGTIFAVMPAFIYWLAGMLAIQGDPNAPTIGDIVAFTTLQSRLFFPLGQLLNVQVEVQGALALFDRIFEYLDMQPEISDEPGAVTLRPADVRGHVRFRHVSFTYPSTARPLALAEAELAVDAGEPWQWQRPRCRGPGRHGCRRGARHRPRRTSAGDAAPGDGGGQPFGLVDIDFEAQPGQLVALVGPSGAGKTTTTYLLPRLYDVDEGAIEVDGRDVRGIRLASLGDVIGFVTQEAYLFHASVRENLAYAKPEATDREIQAAARLAAIHDRIRELPDGYDTVVGERGYKLSGGEKQRVALARVLLKDPRILILDEATSALDTVSERLIQRAVEVAMRGRTTLAIAHRLSTILKADLILVYERGRIVERGTHADLLALGGSYARLYHEQFEAVRRPAGAPALGPSPVPRSGRL